MIFAMKKNNRDIIRWDVLALAFFGPLGIAAQAAVTCGHLHHIGTFACCAVMVWFAAWELGNTIDN